MSCDFFFFNGLKIQFIFFYMFTQGMEEGEFELMTSASYGVVYSQLSYPLEMAKCNFGSCI
jgi:hypothetical protein